MPSDRDEHSHAASICAPQPSKGIVARLNAMLAKAANAPDAKDALGGQGFEPWHAPPEQFAAFICGETQKDAKLVQ